jgi:hypothetical protein
MWEEFLTGNKFSKKKQEEEVKKAKEAKDEQRKILAKKRATAKKVDEQSLVKSNSNYNYSNDRHKQSDEIPPQYIANRPPSSHELGSRLKDITLEYQAMKSRER